MLQVIDSFAITAHYLAEYPTYARLYAGREGVVAIPDPEQDCPIDIPSGTLMRLHRPNGTTATLTLTAVFRPHRAVGLFFATPATTDIPRLSRLEALLSY